MVGIPWVAFGRSIDGFDCYGLVVVAFRDMLGIDLPSYVGRYDLDARANTAALIGEQSQANWQRVDVGCEDVFDVALVREGRDLSHVGLVVSPGYLLHVERGGASMIECYRRSPLKHRVAAFYRHAMAIHE